jgi:hypothetical protein
MPAESEATAYYVVSEAFANAVKHARRYPRRAQPARFRHGPHRSPASRRSIRLTSAFRLAGRPELVVAGVGAWGLAPMRRGR